MVAFISTKLGLPRLELDNYLIDPKIIELVPALKIGSRLTCVMVDPWNVFALDEVRMRTNLIVEPAVATEGEIRRALDQYYGTKGTMEDLIKSIDDKKLGLEDKEIDIKKLEGIVEEPAVWLR